ncbi:TPA: hypothetical protein ACL0L1_002076, partial [Streptococcus pneumoniae]
YKGDNNWENNYIPRQTPLSFYLGGVSWYDLPLLKLLCSFFEFSIIKILIVLILTFHLFLILICFQKAF